MSDNQKTYVLDTSVLLAYPKAIYAFEEHQVVIPLVVITELESKRHDPELGHQARQVLNTLDHLGEKGNTEEGVVINEQGGSIRIEINHINQSNLPDAVRNSRHNDARILAVAHNFKKQGHDVVLVSKDVPLRVLARAVGLVAEGLLADQVTVDESYTGLVEVEVPGDIIDTLYSHKSMDVALVDATDTDWGDVPVNTGVRLIGPGKQSALAVYSPDKRLNLIDNDLNAFGVSGRSAEQRIALSHLLNPSVGVVSLGGRAGSGKSSLAIAAGLEQVMEQRRYKKVIVFRPLFAVGGQELGYLPGSAEEKMGPWAAAVFDALESMASKEVIDEIVDRKMLEVLPLTHIRGRSLHDAFVIVDEAQSLERLVLATALTRIGRDAKIVLTHDVSQRDNLHVGRYDGVAAVVERLKHEPLFAHATLTKSERSAVAEMASRMLDF